MAFEAHFNNLTLDNSINNWLNWTTDKEGLYPIDITGTNFPGDYDCWFDGTHVNVMGVAEFDTGALDGIIFGSIRFPSDATVQPFDCAIFTGDRITDIHIPPGGRIEVAPGFSSSFSVGSNVVLTFDGVGTIMGSDRYDMISIALPTLVYAGTILYIQDASVYMPVVSGVSPLTLTATDVTVSLTNGNIDLIMPDALTPPISYVGGNYPIFQDNGPAGYGDDGSVTFVFLETAPASSWWASMQVARVTLGLDTTTTLYCALVPTYEAVGGVPPCMDAKTNQLILSGGSSGLGGAVTFGLTEFISTDAYSLLGVYGNVTVVPINDISITAASFHVGNLTSAPDQITIDFSAHTVDIDVLSLQILGSTDLAGFTNINRGDGSLTVGGFFTVMAHEWNDGVGAPPIQVNEYSAFPPNSSMNVRCIATSGTLPNTIELNGSTNCRVALGQITLSGDLTLTTEAKEVSWFRVEHATVLSTEVGGTIDLRGTPKIRGNLSGEAYAVNAGVAMLIDDGTRVSGMDIRDSTAKPANARLLYNMDWGTTYGFDFRRDPA